MNKAYNSAACIKNSIKQFQTELDRTHIQYPRSYQSIGMNRAANAQIQSITRAIALFNDYYKKNWFFLFHRRHHDKVAEEIEFKLGSILSQNNTTPDKIKKAKDFILQEENKLAKKIKINNYNKKGSSFFRRAHYALEILDDELKRVEGKDASRVSSYAQ